MSRHALWIGGKLHGQAVQLPDHVSTIYTLRDDPLWHRFAHRPLPEPPTPSGVVGGTSDRWDVRVLHVGHRLFLCVVAAGSDPGESAIGALIDAHPDTVRKVEVTPKDD